MEQIKLPAPHNSFKAVSFFLPSAFLENIVQSSWRYVFSPAEGPSIPLLGQPSLMAIISCKAGLQLRSKSTIRNKIHSLRLILTFALHSGLPLFSEQAKHHDDGHYEKDWAREPQESKAEVENVTVVGYVNCSADRDTASQRDGRGTLS